MELTKRREIFAKEYVKTDNASAAYRVAFSSKNMKDETVTNNAYMLLKNSDVLARVNELKAIAMEIAEKEFKTDSTELLRHLTILRNARIDEYVDFVEIVKVIGIDEETDEEIKVSERVLQFKPFDQLTEEQLMCIESIKDTRYGIELKLHGKDWTIEKIAKHIGFYEKDNKQKSVDVNLTNYDNLSLEEIKQLEKMSKKLNEETS